MIHDGVFIAVPLQNMTPTQYPKRPTNVHVSQLSLYAPGTLNYLMFSANALSSLCSCIGVTLSACSDPATCSLDIFLLILQYLTGASSL